VEAKASAVLKEAINISYWACKNLLQKNGRKTCRKKKETGRKVKQVIAGTTGTVNYTK